MGGLSAMYSITRVMNAHGDEMQREWEQRLPETLRPLFKCVALETKNYGIQVWWEFQGGNLEGPLIHIDDLADLYPDCKVAY